MQHRRATPMKIVKHPRPPAGLRRLLFRSPISIYRVGLGAVFGRRLLLLHHTGRRTGASRKTVLEVVQYDPTDRSYVVASGWDRKPPGTAISLSSLRSALRWATAPSRSPPSRSLRMSAPRSSPAMRRGVPGSRRSRCRGCWACPLTGPMPTSERLGDECRSCAWRPARQHDGMIRWARASCAQPRRSPPPAASGRISR